jgi:hypothetical protein
MIACLVLGGFYSNDNGKRVHDLVVVFTFRSLFVTGTGKDDAI